MNLPTPAGMKFVYHKPDLSHSDPFCSVGSSAWKWTTKKKYQYGMAFRYEKGEMPKTEQELLAHFWRCLGAI